MASESAPRPKFMTGVVEVKKTEKQMDKKMKIMSTFKNESFLKGFQI